jgi:CHRD domain
MRRIGILATAAVLVAATAAAAFHNNQFRRIREFLNGHKEVPVVATAGKGTFSATINKEGTEIAYKLRYADLEGTVTQAHIHVGPVQNTGGISVWLCSNLTSPPTPAGVQACPPSEGGAEIEGVITSADVVGPTAQGFDPGEFAELLEAMRAGLTYVNVHSTRIPGGEIRSQISPGDHGGHDR